MGAGSGAFSALEILIETHFGFTTMKQILIVEDNAAFRRLLKQILSLRFPSMDIEEASNGSEALRKIGTINPDLVFMDIRLPGANGLDLTRK